MNHRTVSDRVIFGLASEAIDADLTKVTAEKNFVLYKAKFLVILRKFLQHFDKRLPFYRQKSGEFQTPGAVDTSLSCEKTYISETVSLA